MLPLPFLNGVFVFITVLCLWLLYRASGRNKQVLFVSVAWLTLQGLISITGFYQDYSVLPPKFLLAVVPALAFVLLIFILPSGKKFIASLDPAWLTYLHAVRIPVEVTLVMLWLEGMVPREMTFEGMNYDILAGLSAPFISWFGYVKKSISRTGLILWNAMCLGLLINIVVTAVLSAPFPFQKFGMEQPNVAVFYYPFIWLPAFIVPVVLFSHLVLLKSLFRPNPS
jgi:hypothetical protein